MDLSPLAIRAHLQRKEFQLDVELDVPQQGITAILGPSGSGKSTLLRLLAGLEKLQQGSIRFGDTVWADVAARFHLPPQQRRIGMVFQDYALFAHKTVAQNIAYGIAANQRELKLPHCLQRLQLSKLADRYPAQLSGGQRQRVALARALITEPALLLLDEPFSAVDANLRQTLRQQLKASVSEAGCPAMLVTHHLEDVYYLADHIGVMADGQLLQFGNKQQVLHQPNCKRVAELVGWQNFLAIRGITSDRVYGDWGEYALPREADINTAWLTIRAEHVQLFPAGVADITAEVVEIYELGMTRIISCRLRGGARIQKFQSLDLAIPRLGDKVSLAFPLAHTRVLPDVYTSKQPQRAPLHVVKTSTDSEPLAHRA
jgi:ABC-type sulfate/molybdate transport systems ATPase subunit